MSRLNKRQSTFAEYYANPTSETHGNATQSYIKAGYSANKADTNASKLLKIPKIAQKINQIILEITRQANIDIDEKKAIALNHYKQAKTDTLKLKWWQEYNALCGSYVNRQEISVDDRREAIRQAVRDQLFEESSSN